MPKTRSLALTGGTVLLPDGSLAQTTVRLENGRIAALGGDSPAGETLALDGLTVLPGLIDLHTHGIGRISTDEGALAEYARIEASRGTTTFFPTMFSPPEVTVANMKRHLAESNNLRDTPQVGGFRLESPYLAETGAGVSKDLSPIRREVTDMLLEAGDGHVKLWDVSPELSGAPGFIAECSERGIVTSLAHTLASIDRAREAVDAGAKLVTHLFDTFEQPVVTDPDPGVYPAGLTDYLLVEDRVMCEIIGDGTHVHPILVEMTFRCKSPGRTVFVTDSNWGAGLGPGDYLLPGSWGNVRIDGANKGVRMLDRGMELAGSALTPIDSFRNVVGIFGKDLATASRVWSKSPAELLGLNKGEIAAGRDADLIAIDDDFTVRYTIAGGEIVYRG